MVLDGVPAPPQKYHVELQPATIVQANDLLRPVFVKRNARSKRFPSLGGISSLNQLRQAVLVLPSFGPGCGAYVGSEDWDWKNGWT